MLLTTYRRNGTAVSTPVSIAIRHGLVYFVTATNSGKSKRLSRNDRVSLAERGAGSMVKTPVEGHATLMTDTGLGDVLRLVRPTLSLAGSYLWYRLRCLNMGLYRVVLDPPAPPMAGGTRPLPCVSP